jgi:dTDP-4-amino-4,6-dideoxygalactose transaminase
LFVVRSANRDALRAYLSERGIETGIHYPTPLHLTPAYQALGYPGPGSLPVAERLAEEVVSLPMYPELTGAHIREVVAALQDFAAAQLEPARALSEFHSGERAAAA